MQTIYQDEYLDYIDGIICTEKVDAVQNEYYEQLDLVYALPKGVRKIFIQHEIQYVAKSDGLTASVGHSS